MRSTSFSLTDCRTKAKENGTETQIDKYKKRPAAERKESWQSSTSLPVWSSSLGSVLPRLPFKESSTCGGSEGSVNPCWYISRILWFDLWLFWQLGYPETNDSRPQRLKRVRIKQRKAYTLKQVLLVFFPLQPTISHHRYSSRRWQHHIQLILSPNFSFSKIGCLTKAKELNLPIA